MAQKYLVPEDYRHLYGMKGLVVFASSHPLDPACLCDFPSTYTPQKAIFALGETDRHFAQVFEDKLHDKFVSVLPDCTWGLNVFRLGFELESVKNPITIHLTFADGAISDDAACKIVADFLEAIEALGASSIQERIHVNVCRGYPPSQQPPHELSVLDRNPEVYSSATRLPYSSIGPKGIDCAGTLSGYIQHCDEDGRNTIYGLTCRHVVDPHDSLDNASYTQSKGHRNHQVQSPALADHSSTMELMRTMIDSLQWSSENGAYDFHTNHYRILRAIGTMLPIVSGAIHRYCNANHIANMEQALDRIKQYDIDFGHVYASSGLGRLLPQFQGRSDWAILAINDTNVPAKNKHVRTAGSFTSFKRPEGSQLDNGFLRAATQYFHPGPYFKPTRNDDLTPGELVFKPRSRTMNMWVGGTFNAIRSTQNTAERKITTREWCLVALNPKGAMSAPGDSGSIILDGEFRPVAMIWGGDEHNFAMGPRDVTYASPLTRVLRDIEKCLGWIEGSVSMV